MAEKVEIIIEADDNASAKIDDVGDALANLSSTATKENLMDLRDAAGRTFTAIGSAVGELSKLAAEDELVAMRLDAQLKALGETASVSEKDITDLATELSKLSGFDDEALVQGQTTLLRFGTLSKEQFEQATEAAADLAAMTGMDLVSAFQQVGIALDNPAQGFGRLKRQIGDLTDEQKAAIEQMIKMGDEAGAQGLILDALAGKVDGAAEAYGETFTGKVGKAQTVVDNFKSSLGELANSAAPQWLITFGVAAQEAGGMLGPIVSGVADLGLALMALQKGGAIAGVGVALKGAFAGVAALIGGITAPVWMLIAAIVALLVVIKTMGPEAKNTLDMLAQIFIAGLNRIKFEITTWFNNLRTEFVTKAKESFGEVGAAIVDGIFEGIKKAWPLLLGPAGLPLFLRNLLQGALNSLNAGSPSQLWADMVGDEAIVGGVNKGIEQGGKRKSPIGNMLQPGGGGLGGRGGNITVVLQYAPAVSMASRAEAEAVIAPYVADSLRRFRK